MFSPLSSSTPATALPPGPLKKPSNRRRRFKRDTPQDVVESTRKQRNKDAAQDLRSRKKKYESELKFKANSLEADVSRMEREESDLHIRLQNLQKLLAFAMPTLVHNETVAESNKNNEQLLQEAIGGTPQEDQGQGFHYSSPQESLVSSPMASYDFEHAFGGCGLTEAVYGGHGTGMESGPSQSLQQPQTQTQNQHHQFQQLQDEIDSMPPLNDTLDDMNIDFSLDLGYENSSPSSSCSIPDSSSIASSSLIASSSVLSSSQVTTQLDERPNSSSIVSSVDLDEQDQQQLQQQLRQQERERERERIEEQQQQQFGESFNQDQQQQQQEQGQGQERPRLQENQQSNGHSSSFSSSSSSSSSFTSWSSSSLSSHPRQEIQESQETQGRVNQEIQQTRKRKQPQANPLSHRGVEQQPAKENKPTLTKATLATLELKQQQQQRQQQHQHQQSIKINDKVVVDNNTLDQLRQGTLSLQTLLDRMATAVESSPQHSRNKRNTTSSSSLLESQKRKMQKELEESKLYKKKASKTKTKPKSKACKLTTKSTTKSTKPTKPTLKVEQEQQEQQQDQDHINNTNNTNNNNDDVEQESTKTAEFFSLSQLPTSNSSLIKMMMMIMIMIITVKPASNHLSKTDSVLGKMLQTTVQFLLNITILVTSILSALVFVLLSQLTLTMTLNNNTDYVRHTMESSLNSNSIASLTSHHHHHLQEHLQQHLQQHLQHYPFQSTLMIPNSQIIRKNFAKLTSTSTHGKSGNRHPLTQLLTMMTTTLFTSV